MLHLGVDAPDVDVYVNGDSAVTELAFQAGTDYVSFPPGATSIAITATGTPIEDAVLNVDGLELEGGKRYSAVAYDYLANISALALEDDDSGIEAGNIRYQVAHTAPDVGEVDIWVIDGEPAPLLTDLEFGETDTVDAPAGAVTLGIDVNDDEVPDLSFSVPDLGDGVLVNVFAVNEAGGSPVFLLAHLPDGNTARLDPNCGNGAIDAGEVCDGDELGGETCETQGFNSGELGCAASCAAFDTSACSSGVAYCTEASFIIPDNDTAGIDIPVNVPDAGTITDVNVTLDISHSFLNDLDIELTHNGTTVLIADEFQDQGAGVCAGVDLVATVDDEAAEPLLGACFEDNVPAVEGSFTPAGMLSDFDGQDINGEWTLFVADLAFFDSGQVNEFCVELEVE